MKPNCMYFQIGDQFKIHSFLNKFHIMVTLRWTQCMYTLNCSKPSKSKSLFYLPQILDFMVIVKLMIQDRLFGESGRTSRKILFHTSGLFSSPIFDFSTFSKCLVKSNLIVFSFFIYCFSFFIYCFCIFHVASNWRHV